MEKSSFTIAYGGSCGSDDESIMEEIDVLEGSSEGVEDSTEVVEYPWPCPENWPLVPAKTVLTAIKYDRRSMTESSCSPCNESFPRDTLSLPPSSVTKGDTDSKTSRWSSPYDFNEKYEPSIISPSKAASTTGRSMTSISSRRNRSSLIETFNRKYVAAYETIQERKIHFPAQFQSRRIVQPALKPWKDKVDPRVRAAGFIPFIGIFLGLAIGCYLIYTGWAGVPKHDWCLVLDEDWSNGIDPTRWTHEVELGGFGTGEFEWATDFTNNSYVKDGRLYITPTLTSDYLGEAAITDGYTLDLTADGSCTGTSSTDCVATSNSTLKTVLPPVQSARLVSQGKFSLKYGKIEVVARMPRGDWLWPAIWMLPEDNVYGAWPLSGEIDITESRGNAISYKDGGRNVVSTTLHWGPSSADDAFWRTNAVNTEFHSDYTNGFFTFGLEWTSKYLYTYIETHLRQVFYIKFLEPFFTRGQWPAVDATNGTAITNPWAGSENINVAPFDEAFYLILNVAVGTSYGFFPDGVGNKPWVDGSASARSDFYAAKDIWYPTWGTNEDRSMVVESVKAWQICGT